MAKSLFTFRIRLLIRLGLILLVLIVTWYVWRQYYWLVSVWTALLSLALIGELIYYTEKEQRELRNFVLAIEQGDFTNHYAGSNTPSIRSELKQAYSSILARFQQLRSEKESHYRYLQTTVEQVSIGIISYDQEESIILYNEAARRMFRRPHLTRLQVLEKVATGIPDRIRSLKHGQSDILKIQIDGKLHSLSMLATEMSLLGKSHKLITFQDLTYQLEAQEADSWHKLIRVLTHEITNSVIPISTLSSLSAQMLVGPDGEKIELSSLDEEDADDLHQSLQTIANRSKGLVSFIKSYKSLTQASELSIRQVDMRALFQRITTLLSPRLEQAGIRLTAEVSEEVSTLSIDLEMIEQVLINLILNAADALSKQSAPLISVRCFTDHIGSVQIEVIDNGEGMEPDMVEEVFIPFYTTKDTGSGIGLSFARQIMRLHKGSISLFSQLGEGTRVSLRF